MESQTIWSRMGLGRDSMILEHQRSTRVKIAPCRQGVTKATIRAMHVAFVVHVVKGVDPEELLSAETKKETQAVCMSLEDAGKMGFSASGVQVKPGMEVCLIVVAQRDAPWIARSLEQHDHVGGFQQIDVNIG